MAPQDLLHSALTRHALSQVQSQSSGLSALSLSESDPTSPVLPSSFTTEDTDLIEVLTAPPTPSLSPSSTPGTSRSSSPTRRSGKGAGKPRRDKTKERQKELSNRGEGEGIKGDIFVRFGGTVLGIVLAELGVDDLLAVGGVSKRWRRSMTLNYTWYLLIRSLTFETPTIVSRITSPSASSGLPTWSRSDSSISWVDRFADLHKSSAEDEKRRTEGSEWDEEGRTQREEKEDKWREEDEEEEERAGSKGEMRKFYKTLGNSKVKGKTGKGSARTWEAEGEDSFGGGGGGVDI